MVGLYPGLVRDLRHRHGGNALQDFCQQAFMARVQVRHQHEGHAGVRRAGAEELLKGFKPSGGSTYPANGEGGGGRWLNFIHAPPRGESTRPMATHRHRLG